MFMVLKESRGIESNKQDSWVLASATELPEPVEIRWRLGLGLPREIPPHDLWLCNLASVFPPQHSTQMKCSLALSLTFWNTFCPLFIF